MDSDVVLVPFLRGERFQWKLDLLVMRRELFHVHGSERRPLVDVNPKLRDSLLRVFALRKLDHRAHDLLFVDTATALLRLIAEHPSVWLALPLQQAQRTSLVSLRLHTDLLLCVRTDG